ncbi:hypothetical protein BH11MYX2_BH11MYX2_00920 [soil metagenome]
MRCLSLAVLLTVGCGGGSNGGSGAVDGGPRGDAPNTIDGGQGPSDAPGIDAPGSDAGGMDAGGIDAGGIDAGGIDAGGIDAPGIDAPGIDAPLATDAAVDAVNLCPAPLSFGTVTARSPQAVNEAGPPADIKYSDNLDADATPDIFKLVLIDGRGAFTGGYAAGTYTIAGAETKYATCGACVEIFANVDASSNFAAFYLAQSGTLAITSVTPRLTGTLTNADLIHLNDDDTVNSDSCVTHIDSLAFDVAVQ